LSGKAHTIPTNLRLLCVLEEVARVGVPVTPTDVNAALNLPKPTIHRLFATLEQEGYIQREPDGRSYSCGRRLRAVGTLSSLRSRTARLAVMERLAGEIGETCNLAIPERTGMVYLDRVETKWPLRIQLPVGTEVPFYCTASGKLYLSSLNPTHLKRYLASASFERYTPKTLITADALRNELDAIRRRGYSTDNEEFLEGMIAVAVPIVEPHGRMFATLSIHAPVQRLSLRRARGFAERLHETAAELASLATAEM